MEHAVILNLKLTFFLHKGGPKHFFPGTKGSVTKSQKETSTLIIPRDAKNIVS